MRIIESKKADKIPGGLADEKSPKDFDKDQIAKGVKVEMEHTDDKELAKEITMDHLTENDKYYDHLEEMEKDMDKDSFSIFDLHKTSETQLQYSLDKFIPGKTIVVFTMNNKPHKKRIVDVDKIHGRIIVDINGKNVGIPESRVQIADEEENISDIPLPKANFPRTYKNLFSLEKIADKQSKDNDSDEKDCLTPGRKIRSKGKGKGLGIGKGKGPIGIPKKRTPRKKRLVIKDKKDCLTPGEKIRSKGKGKGLGIGGGKGPIGVPKKRRPIANEINSNTNKLAAKNKKKKDKWNPNPWAVCHATVDKDEEPEKYERCVKKVKKNQKKSISSKVRKFAQEASYGFISDILLEYEDALNYLTQEERLPKDYAITIMQEIADEIRNHYVETPAEAAYGWIVLWKAENSQIHLERALKLISQFDDNQLRELAELFDGDNYDPPIPPQVRQILMAKNAITDEVELERDFEEPDDPAALRGDYLRDRQKDDRAMGDL